MVATFVSGGPTDAGVDDDALENDVDAAAAGDGEGRRGPVGGC